MKVEDIAKFAGNVVTFAGLPSLIFFNFAATLFFLNEWRSAVIWGTITIFIGAGLCYYLRGWRPNRSTRFLLLSLAVLAGVAVFHNPYPGISLISISGFYNDKDGAWISSNTDENTADIVRKIDETWDRATSRENPLFRFVKPESITSWQFPGLFLTHRSKEQIISLAQKNARSAIVLVGFTHEGKMSELHYSLNENAMSPNAHDVSHENLWFNHLFAKVIGNASLSDAQKREIIAKILFIDLNARALSVRRDSLDSVGMANFVIKTREEVADSQKLYPFIKNELNYLMAGLTVSFVDVYDKKLTDAQTANFLIDALSDYPYYPYPDKESFQRAYVRSSYANWGLSRAPEKDEALLGHLAQRVYSLPDAATRQSIVDDFKKRVFLPHPSPVLFYQLLEMMKAVRPLLDIPPSQAATVRELEGFTDKYLHQHADMDDEFVELKSALLYGVYHMWYLKNRRGIDAAKSLKKFERLLADNPNIKQFLMRIYQENAQPAPKS